VTDYFSDVMTGLGNVLSFPNIFIPVIGTVVAMVGSFLPGIGNTSLAALVLIATIHWDPVSVLLMFGALTGGATFMGSITAILFNVPGNAPSAAVLLDGHPMARNGQARTAIACAATASAVGSLFGILALLAILPLVRPFLLEFGPLERVLLGIWGLSTIISIPNSSPSRALAVTLLGLICAMIGSDPTTGLERWTFGSLQLFDGFGNVAVLLGFFTLSEIIGWRKSYTISSEDRELSTGSTLEGVKAVFRHPGLTLRSSILGSVVGVIPGVGGTVASFVAYSQAVQTCKRPETFGTGDIRGVIAPEAAVDSKDGGSLLPVLAFGLPGSEGGVILVTVLGIHGLTPGLPMLTDGLSLSLTLIFALLLSNILTSIIGVSLSPALARLTRLRIDRVALPALVATLVTIVQLNGFLADLYVAVAFGLLGFVFKRLDWPRVPFIIAFILGAFIERNFALVLPLVSVGRINFWDRPAAIIIAALIILSMLWMLSGRKKAQLEKAKPRGPEDTVLAGILCIITLALALAPFYTRGSYSDYALTMAWCATALLGAITVLGAAGGRHPRLEPAIARIHLIPVVLLALTPPLVWALGLPVSMAALTFAWLMTGTEFSVRRPMPIALLALLVFAGTFYYVAEFAGLRLPDPAILTVMDGLPFG
jgi:putative tricarboxylic transport membrane protein